MTAPQIGGRLAAVIMVASIPAWAVACGGGRPAATPGMTLEVVEQMKAPEDPYRIIYAPPVWLGKESPEPGQRRRRS